MTRGCRAEPSRLLDFYVNGTLSGPERDRVAAHLATCSLCAREVAEIEEVGRLLSRAAGDGPIETSARRPLRLLWAAGAIVALGALGIWIGARSPEPRRVVTLDLGAGGARAGRAPGLAIAEDVAFVEVLFSLTPEPGATYTVSLYDPQNERVFGPAPLAAWDSLGTSRQRFPADLFSMRGEYRLDLEESLRGDTPRRYDYIFMVGEKR